MTMTLLALLAACSGPSEPAPGDPGRVVLHRLNRAEYDNTVRDLFGTSLRPARRFPADDFGLGFDNQAHVLSLSPLHVEQYGQAADELLDELFAVGSVPPSTVTLESETDAFRADNGAIWDATAWVLWTDGALATELWLEAGDYTLRVDALAQQGGDELVRMAVRVDGVEVAELEVEATEDPARHEIAITVDQGVHELAVVFLNDLKAPPDVDRNLIVDRLVVTGPLGVPRQPPPGRDRVLTCDPAEIGEAACVEQIVRSFGRRAWRRPLTSAEVDAKLAQYAAARDLRGSWDEGVRAALTAILLSPHFVYRVEPDPAPGVARELNGYELATRLSYFVWSSTPDDRLLDLAATGALRDDAVLEAEARRMLDDPRAVALVENLAGQWLSLRKVEDAQPSPTLFPEWDEGLRASMRDELHAFVAGVLLADRSSLELLTAPDTFVDARLARHYGVDAPGDPGLHRVELPERAGLLGKAGLLTALSYPTRTSPVLRGKWVLEGLLCSAPPPPPDGVPALDDQQESGPVSLRESMERHLTDPSCAACHAVMDPIGFALEPFDALGRERTLDDYGFPIDPEGVLPDGTVVDSPGSLAAALVGDPRFPACVVEKTMLYALGRPLTVEDAPRQAALERHFALTDYRFRELVVAMVQSRQFRWQGDE